MVYRVYVEKKQGFTHEADALLSELVQLVGVKGLTSLRVINRYDVENVSSEVFNIGKSTVIGDRYVVFVLLGVELKAVGIKKIDFEIAGCGLVNE